MNNNGFNIGDLVKSIHEPNSVGLVIDLPTWVKDASMDDEEWDEYCVAYIMWVRDEIEPLYKSMENLSNLEVLDVQSR